MKRIIKISKYNKIKRGDLKRKWKKNKMHVNSMRSCRTCVGIPNSRITKQTYNQVEADNPGIVGIIWNLRKQVITGNQCDYEKRIKIQVNVGNIT